MCSVPVSAPSRPCPSTSFFFVEFGGDGNMWVMGESTGIPYQNVWASDCGNGVDNRIKVKWKLNLPDNQLHVTIQTFGRGAVKRRFGPYSIPEPLRTEGWEACIFQVPPGNGSLLLRRGQVCFGGTARDRAGRRWQHDTQALAWS